MTVFLSSANDVKVILTGGWGSGCLLTPASALSFEGISAGDGAVWLGLSFWVKGEDDYPVTGFSLVFAFSGCVVD